LLLVACTSTGPAVDVHKGTQGLVLEFDKTKNAVPASQPFVISGTVTNEGASHVGYGNIGSGIMSIGIEKQYLLATGERRDMTKDIALSGRNPDQLMGERKPFSVNLESLPLPGLTETVTTNVMFTLCYPYKTEASATICIDTAEQREERKPCTMRSIGMSGGQGAPVAVTLIEPSILPAGNQKKAAFDITVNNVGNGNVIGKDNIYDACRGNPQNIDEVVLRAYLADQLLQCGKNSAETTVQLKPGKNKAHCTLSSVSGTYTTVIRVELDYGYMTSNNQQVEITSYEKR
jgi:hypothetical protein